jgi:hypothetical protein
VAKQAQQLPGMRLGDAKLLERVRQLEAELAEADACCDEAEALADELSQAKAKLEHRLGHLEVRGGFYMRGFDKVGQQGLCPCQQGLCCMHFMGHSADRAH